jgi:hypothetical protein
MTIFFALLTFFPITLGKIVYKPYRKKFTFGKYWNLTSEEELYVRGAGKKRSIYYIESQYVGYCMLLQYWQIGQRRIWHIGEKPLTDWK